MSVGGFLGWVKTGLKSLGADRRGSVTVDFIVSIPILLGILVLTSEYGRVLQARATLDNAVADSARYLSRMPLNPGTGDFTTPTVETAEAIIEARISTPFLNIADPVVDESNGFTTVRMSAAAGIVSPALGLLALMNSAYETPNGDRLSEIEGLVIVSSETVRHFGR